MQIEIPDGLKPDAEILVPISYLITTNKTINALVLDAATANDKATAAEMKADELAKTVQDLQKKLEAALKPPPVVVPSAPPVPPRVDVWKDEPAFSIDGLIMATIENSMGEPSAPQYTAVKRGADALDALDVKAVRFWLGPLEVAAHIDPKANSFGSFGNLVDYVRGKKMHYIFDAMDRALQLLNNTQLKDFVKWLQDLRTWAVCWNDADKESVAKLKADVERLRDAGWKGPIIFSLRGSVLIEDYDEIKDIIFEFQTFGKPTEFPGFAKTDADFLCLDLREPQTKEALAHIFSVAVADDVKRTKPRGYTLYTSKTRDWVNTPQDEVDEIRKFTRQVHAQAQP